MPDRKRTKLRRRLARLVKQQHGKCHWCAKPMLVLGYIPGERRQYFDDEATLDHLYSRLNPLRPRNGERQPMVAACRRCNLKRSEFECAAASLSKPVLAEITDYAAEAA